MFSELGDDVKAAEYYQRHVFDRLDIKYDEKNLQNFSNEIEFFQQNDNIVIDSDIAEGLLFLANAVQAANCRLNVKPKLVPNPCHIFNQYSWFQLNFPNCLSFC